jgi:hypothetical protein
MAATHNLALAAKATTFAAAVRQLLAGLPEEMKGCRPPLEAAILLADKVRQENTAEGPRKEPEIPAANKPAAQTPEPAGQPPAAANDLPGVIAAALAVGTLAALRGAIDAAGLVVDDKTRGSSKAMTKALTLKLAQLGKPPAAAAESAPKAEQPASTPAPANDRPRCVGTTKAGEPCDNHPRKGYQTCGHHKDQEPVAVAPTMTLYVQDGKGGYRPATRAEVEAALAAMTKPAAA